LDIQHVGALISSINALGYDPMSAKGLAVELGLGEEGKQVRSFNEKLISGSEGRLGSQSTIRFASLDGSHGNYASRSVFSQGVHNDPAITEGGRISHQKINSEWLEHIKAGITWTIIRQEVITEFPSIVCLVQQAGNAVQGQSATESELQVALKISAALTRYPRGCQFSEIEDEIMLSRPSHKECIPFIFQFAVQFGSETEFSVTCEYIRALGGGLKAIGSGMWDSLSQSVNQKASVSWRHMLLRASFGAMLSPADALRSNHYCCSHV